MWDRLDQVGLESGRKKYDPSRAYQLLEPGPVVLLTTDRPPERHYDVLAHDGGVRAATRRVCRQQATLHHRGYGSFAVDGAVTSQRRVKLSELHKQEVTWSKPSLSPSWPKAARAERHAVALPWA